VPEVRRAVPRGEDHEAPRPAADLPPRRVRLRALRETRDGERRRTTRIEGQGSEW
jgi:hypothetical protein